MWDRRARVVEVTDGDTLKVVLDQGFGDTKEISVRLLGTFAPESSQVGGKETKAFVQAWVAAQPAATWPVVVTTALTRSGQHEVQSFARYLGTVTSLDGTDNLNAEVSAFVAAHGFPGGIGS